VLTFELPLEIVLVTALVGVVEVVVPDAVDMVADVMVETKIFMVVLAETMEAEEVKWVAMESIPRIRLMLLVRVGTDK
jgi:hypothetical protein